MKNIVKIILFIWIVFWVLGAIGFVNRGELLPAIISLAIAVLGVAHFLRYRKNKK